MIPARLRPGERSAVFVIGADYAVVRKIKNDLLQHFRDRITVRTDVSYSTGGTYCAGERGDIVVVHYVPQEQGACDAPALVRWLQQLEKKPKIIAIAAEPRSEKSFFFAHLQQPDSAKLLSHVEAALSSPVAVPA